MRHSFKKSRFFALVFICFIAFMILESKRVISSLSKAQSQEDNTQNNNNIKLNSTPELLDGKVEPEYGSDSDDFTFSVIYKDTDGDLPTQIYVSIDGSFIENAFDLSYVSGSHSSGAKYEYTIGASGWPRCFPSESYNCYIHKGLTAGSHSFYFYCSDGKDGAMTNVISGPNVYSDDIEPISIGELLKKLNENPTDQNPLIGKKFKVRGAVLFSGKEIVGVTKSVIDWQKGLSKYLLKKIAQISPTPLGKLIKTSGDKVINFYATWVGTAFETFLGGMWLYGDAAGDQNFYDELGYAPFITVNSDFDRDELWAEKGSIVELVIRVGYSHADILEGNPKEGFICYCEELNHIEPSGYTPLRPDIPIGTEVDAIGYRTHGSNACLLWQGHSYIYIEDFPQNLRINSYSLVLVSGILNKYEYDENSDIPHEYSIKYKNVEILSGKYNADTDYNGLVGDFELLDYIDLWAEGLVSDFHLLDAIDWWANKVSRSEATVTRSMSKSIGKGSKFDVNLDLNVNATFKPNGTVIREQIPQGLNFISSTPEANFDSLSYELSWSIYGNDVVDQTFTYTLEVPANAETGTKEMEGHVRYNDMGENRDSLIAGDNQIFILGEVNLDSGLVAYYPFNGNANDESGNGNDGTEYGGIVYVDGSIDQAANFDGINDFIRNTNPPVVKILKSTYSICFWIKPTGNQLGGVIDIGKNHEGSWEIEHHNQIVFYYQNWNRSEGIENFSYLPTPLNTWSHISYVYSNKHIDCYLNGKFVSDKDFVNNPVIDGDEWIEIGDNRPGASEFFKGQIDEIRIYNRALTESEIQALYNKVTQVETEIETNQITKFNLMQNYPNPFNESTTIEYSVPKSCNVELVVFNIFGQEIKRIINQKQNAGSYKINWDGTNEQGHIISSGLYFYQLKVDDEIMSKKMLLMK